MGLFDAFKTGNPDTDAQISRGLLMAGLQLMQARGRLFPAIGQAGMAGVVGADQARQMQAQRDERQIRQQLGRLQVGQAQREADLAALPGQFYKPPSSPAVDATGGMETAVEAPQNASGPGGFDMQGYYRALQGMAPVLAEQYKRMITPEAPKPMALGKDQRLVLPTGQEVVPALPESVQDKPTDDIREFMYAMQRGEVPQGMTFTDWLRANKRAGATQLSVPVTMDRTYGGVVAKGLAEQDVAAIDAGRAAPQRLTTAREVKRILETQTPITGTAATWRTEAAKALATAGVIDGKSVSSTEQLGSLLASQTLEAIKTSGLGSGQGFTDKDRQFLERAKSGQIEMTRDALLYLANLNERSAVASINRGNSVIRRLRKDKNFSGTAGGALEEIEIPDAGPVMPSSAAIEEEMRRRGLR